MKRLGLFIRMDYSDSMNPIDIDTLSIDSLQTFVFEIVIVFQILLYTYLVYICITSNLNNK